jgi:hypothetical protein
MSFDPLSGDLGGAPDQEGSFPITLTATTSTQTGDAMCTIDVGPGLAVELPGGCIWPGDDLFDHVNGGDGADIECDTPEGSGEGRLPDGVTVDPTTCAIEGTSSDTYGTWVWITRLTQSGNQVHVPYCFTQDTQLPNAYAITGDHSGAIGNHLEPLVTTFAPGVAVAAGGGGDPYFEVRGPCGANSCYFGFTYAIGASQFGDCGQTDCYGLSPTAIIDPGPGPEGFSHELWALGDPVESGYEARPWVLSWDLHYCISDTEADCNGTAAIEANGDGELRFGMIMLPE